MEIGSDGSTPIQTPTRSVTRNITRWRNQDEENIEKPFRPIPDVHLSLLQMRIFQGSVTIDELLRVVAAKLLTKASSEP